MKQEKKLFNKIKSEGNKIVPNCKDDIFKEIKAHNIKLDFKDKTFIKQIKRENKDFVKNKKNRIYALIGINKQKLNLVDKLIVLKIKREADKVVPNVKNDVFQELNLSQSNNFFKKKSTVLYLSGLTAFAIVISSFGINHIIKNGSIPIISNIKTDVIKPADNDDNGFGDLGTLNAPKENPLPDSMSLLKVEVKCPDASKTKVGPLFSYKVTEQGMVDNNTIVKNETTSYILKADNITSISAADSFVIDIMEGSVKTGYIPSEKNKGISNVKITILSEDIDYIEKYKQRISFLFYSFVSKYHAYVSFDFETIGQETIISKYLNGNSLSDDKQEKVGLIYNIYDYITTSIFTEDKQNYEYFTNLVKIFIKEDKYTLKSISAFFEQLTSCGYQRSVEKSITTLLFKDFYYSYKLQQFKTKYKELLNDEKQNDSIDNGDYFENQIPHNKNLYSIDMPDAEISLINDIDHLYNSIFYFIYDKEYFNSNEEILETYMDYLNAFNDCVPSEDNKDKHNHHNNDSDWTDEEQEDYLEWFKGKYGDNPFIY